jgi:hypothetical protein
MQALILHWDGKAWTHVPSPAVSGTELKAVGAASRTSAMAVGTVGSTTFRTLALRWNGKTWTRVASPNLGAPSFDTFLESVYLASPASGWAVGLATDGTRERSVIERWDGSRWSLVTAPDPGTDSNLLAVGAAPAGGTWAVGDSAGQPYALHCC